MLNQKQMSWYKQAEQGKKTQKQLSDASAYLDLSG